MKLLLDTHVFLWYVSEDQRLPRAFHRAIQDAENWVHLSVASIWEAIVKHSIHKLMLPAPPAEYLCRARE